MALSLQPVRDECFNAARIRPREDHGLIVLPGMMASPAASNRESAGVSSRAGTPKFDTVTPTSLIPDAHHAGLLVHPFTFRPENNFLAADFRLGNPASPEFLRARGDQPAELALFYRLGVDGLFADNADTAVAVREKTFRHEEGDD